MAGTSTSAFTISAGTASTNFAGSGGLTKSGTTAAYLTGASSYSGSTSISNGYLVITNSQALAGTSPVNITSSGTLVLCQSWIDG